MLAVNKCTEAFWIGNLKNRDIRGQEISSQLSSKDKDEDEEQDEEEDEEDDQADQNGQKVRNCLTLHVVTSSPIMTSSIIVILSPIVTS